jgi:hypothetical protein
MEEVAMAFIEVENTGFIFLSGKDDELLPFEQRVKSMISKLTLDAAFKFLDKNIER